MNVSAVTVAHSVDHLAGQLRRGRSEHRTLVRVDTDALAIVLADHERLRGEALTTPVPAGPTRKDDR